MKVGRDEPACPPMELITQAFVLGAGLGKRLRPLTERTPKPLIPIFQKPLITFALDHLIEAGVESFVINTHHRSEPFDDVFAGGAYAGRAVQLVHEPDLLETGGGIKNVERWLQPKPFLVYSGDILTDIALGPLLEEHFRAGNDVTLALRETGLTTDVAFRNRRVIDIAAKFGQEGCCDFAGISIWNPEVFARIPARKKISFIPILLEWIAQNGRIGGVVTNEGQWFNIGLRADYLEVHHTIAEQNWKPRYITDPAWPVRMASDAVVAPSAQISGVCSIGSGCRIGDEAILEDTIVWPGAKIASHSQLRNCIVRSHQKAEGIWHDADI